MKYHINRISIVILVGLISAMALLYFWPFPPLYSTPADSYIIYDDHHHFFHLTLSQDHQYRVFTPLSAIAPVVRTATLLQEDHYFQVHWGVNPISLLRSSWHTYILHGRRLGGSTLTMQVARLRYHINSKTLIGKLRQIMRAIQLEMHYSKKQILEAYFNLAPYGNNIQGVEAASLIYFGKSAHSLTLPEALTLAVIPQNPNKRTSGRAALQHAYHKLYQRWLQQCPTDKNAAAFFKLPLQISTIHSLPVRAPHFINHLRSLLPHYSHHITTSLNLAMQAIIEQVTQRYIMQKSILGAQNAAVLLVDSRTMAIKALLGSAHFFDITIHGQIDGTTTLRSPGSTLKPFIYALAIDQGLIHPHTLLKDVPHLLKNYNPENFDRDFMGPIQAKDALILSRNIPAIALAQQLHQPTFYQFLQKIDLKRLKPESWYGSALALGGIEMSMQELASLYCMLLNKGIWQPLQISPQQSQPPIQKVLLSPEASYLVLDMLQQTPAPGDISASLRQKYAIAWKTGTSSGYRDAWTIGTIGPYVLAVWLGDFDNRSNPAFVGKEIAAPLFFALFHALHPYLTPFSPPPQAAEHLHLTKVKVCKTSGMLATRYCPDTEMVWFIPRKSPIKTDTIHREIAINQRTGLRTCHYNSYTRFKVFEFWTSDFLKVFQEAGIKRQLPPEYEADCDSIPHSTIGFTPQMVSPQHEVQYIVPVAAATIPIPLTAIVDADVKQVYWFCNNHFLGTTRRDQPGLWHAKPGKFILRVVDDQGRTDARTIKVTGAA